MNFARQMLIAALVIFASGTNGVLANSILTEDGSATFSNAPLLAQKPRGGRAGSQRLIEQLNLSNEQVRQLQAIRQKYEQRMNPLMEKMRSSDNQLRQLLASDASADQIRTKRQEVVTLRRQVSDMRFESMLEMRNVLTLDQRRQFAQLMQQRHQRTRDRSNSRPNSNNDLVPDDLSGE